MAININAASKDELLQLPGINEREAEKILAERERRSDFLSREEFMDFLASLDIPPHLYAAIPGKTTVNRTASGSARVIDF